MFKSFFDEKSKSWNARTKYERLHHFKKIEKEVNERYNLDLNFTDCVDYKKINLDPESNIRDIAMDKEDYDKLRKELKRIGISEKYKITTNHAIRKMYAQDSMKYTLGNDVDIKDFDNPAVEKAWVQVQLDLGHGFKARKKLFKTYIQTK